MPMTHPSRYPSKSIASDQGHALRKLLHGPGWRLEVWENSGWHFRVINGPFKLSETKPGWYFCQCGPTELGGDPAYSPGRDFANPNDAVGASLAMVRDHLAREKVFLVEVEGALGVREGEGFPPKGVGLRLGMGRARVGRMLVGRLGNGRDGRDGREVGS